MRTPRTLAILALLAAFGAGTALSWALLRHRPAPAAAIRYTCPMHPEIVQDKPGDCPICGMSLVVQAPAAQPQGPPKDREIAFYRNPMDPSIHSPVPMKDDMGMDYVPVYKDELGAPAPVPGLADVAIDPSYQRLLGVRAVPVEEGPVGGGWTAPAKVAADETRIRKVSTKTGGFVDRLFVDFMGKPVRKGQPLFALYSPDLYSAQQDLALAVKARASLGKDGEALVAAAAQRLRLWDVPGPEIARLEQGGAPQRDLVFTSPVSGVVTAKQVVQGARLQPGDMPFEVTDLSSVWVLADAYAADLPKLRLGARATFTSPALPGRTFTGRVAFIDPVLDPQTRTARVRFAFPNPEGALRPETFGQVAFQGSGRRGLRIPFAAVLEDGTREVVFVDRGEGRFSPQQVELGARDGDWVEVRKGLEAGEQVADKANFLLDADARRRAALAGGPR